MSEKATMAAVGSYEFVLPFKAIGLEAVIITEENISELEHILQKFGRNGCAVLFLEERLFAKYRSIVDEIEGEISIIPLAGSKDSMQVGLSEISRNVERAVGMNIFNDKQ